MHLNNYTIPFPSRAVTRSRSWAKGLARRQRRCRRRTPGCRLSSRRASTRSTSSSPRRWRRRRRQRRKRNGWEIRWVFVGTPAGSWNCVERRYYVHRINQIISLLPSYLRRSRADLGMLRDIVVVVIFLRTTSYINLYKKLYCIS